jgi:hypothetical protein
MIQHLPDALRRHADLIGKSDDPDTATALRWAADEIDSLRDALKQALRQWKMYAEMVEDGYFDSFDLGKEKSPEADLYRTVYALAYESGADSPVGANNRPAGQSKGIEARACQSGSLASTD